MIKPPRLEFGDTIALVSPASAPPDPKNVDRSVAALEKLGRLLGMFSDNATPSTAVQININIPDGAAGVLYGSQKTVEAK